MVLEYIRKYKEKIKECIYDLKHRDTFYKQVPNLLTFSRAIGTIPINILFFTGNIIPAVILTGVILSTDFFDGRIARKWNIQSKFGADLDAVCDKFMFLGLSFPLLISNPIIITNFILEGVISYVNVLGRIKGLDTKTVFAGKIKTWFLSGTLLFGYLSKFFGFPSWIVSILASATFGAQVITIDNYAKEYKRMKKMKQNEKLTLDNDMGESSNKEITHEESLVEQLKQEREFYLGFKDADKEMVPNKRIRCLEDEKKSNNQ